MLIDDVQQAMFQAMKARQPRETAALRLALSALKSAAIDARGDLPDPEAGAVLQREARKRREAEQVYRDAGRTE
ncbi:MAG TPA: GatB/YqeY domain-containing protein, partial [Actinomycetota bacterium]|nr:GatB/YqeY domain-containing protein [Actinomycetota bacterium]